MYSEVCFLNLTHPLLRSSEQLLYSARVPDLDPHQCFCSGTLTELQAYVFKCGGHRNTQRKAMHKLTFLKNETVPKSWQITLVLANGQVGILDISLELHNWRIENISYYFII